MWKCYQDKPVKDELYAKVAVVNKLGEDLIYISIPLTFYIKDNTVTIIFPQKEYSISMS